MDELKAALAEVVAGRIGDADACRDLFRRAEAEDRRRREEQCEWLVLYAEAKRVFCGLEA